jgi:rod shape-determining protein MreC
MALFSPRLRAGYLFLAAIVGHVILISAQVNAKSGVPVLEAVTFGVFAEIQRGSWTIVGGVRRVWGGYFALRDVRAENETLRRELADVQIQLQAQRAQADRSLGLEQLLELKNRTELKTTGAEIIAAGATPDFQTVTINKGESDGLRRDLAVIAPAGIVGRVVVPVAHAAKVQLLIDRNAAAGALVERSRSQGVIMGTGGDLLRMEYVSEVSDVVQGDIVVTSGIDGIFPKGFMIGKVEVVEKSGGAYRKVLVRPAVNFSSLEEVLVVLTPPSVPDPATDKPK